jgi:hypothetical protein
MPEFTDEPSNEDRFTPAPAVEEMNAPEIKRLLEQMSNEQLQNFLKDLSSEQESKFLERAALLRIQEKIDNLPLEELIKAAVSEEVQTEFLRTDGRFIDAEDVANSLPEDCLQLVANHISEEDVAECMKSNTRVQSKPIKSVLLKHPSAILYAVALGMMMISMYLSNPIVALAGVSILLFTGLHYGR